MLTEGGKRHRGFGLSTASKQLWQDLVTLFKDIEIKVKVDKWIHKKYKKEYYGLSFRKDEFPKIMQGYRSGQTDQILAKIFMQEGQP